jgi:site-specific recombinase XerD
MSVWTAQRIIGEAAKRAGRMENVSRHWLRHSAITLWATEMGLPAAQRLAGHRNASMTSRYLRGSDAELKALFKQRIG